MRSESPLLRFLRMAMALGLIGLSGAGCQTYQQQNRTLDYWHRGDLAGAENEATLKASRADPGKDAIIRRLEQGAVLRATGKYAESNQAFDLAEARMNRYAEEAKVRVTHELGALLSNQANLPYEGRAYDGIMLNTYKALNYLQLNQPEAARVEIIRAYQRQQDAVEANQRRIEKVQKTLESPGSSDPATHKVDPAKIEQSRQHPAFKGQLDTAYQDLNRLRAYADFVNPFTVYLDGLFFLTHATGGSDLERARKSLERALAFASDNPYLQADLETANAVIRGQAVPPTTYIVFETGRAPVREHVRIDIPILVSRLSYIGAAFPKLVPQGDYAPYLQVTADGVQKTTALVASMDGVIASEFKKELPVIITKTLASSIAKGVPAYMLNDAANRSDPVFGLITQLFTAAAQAAVNIADLRTWTTLPKEFQVCRIPTPANRKIELLTPTGSQKLTVTLGPGILNLVYVKSVSATGPLWVTGCKLK